MKDPCEAKKSITVNVCISMTVHRNVNVIVDNYDESTYKDEDGNICVDRQISEDELYRAVKEQVYLPTDDGLWSEDELIVIEN